MSITPYSLFTAVLWSSAFILLLYFFRKNTRLLALTGVTPLLFLILGTALRCLFPIEFLHFTNVVGLEGLVAGLFRALRAPLGQLPLQVWEVLLLVWAAGSLGLAARTGFGAWKFHKKLRSYEPLEDSRIERLAQQAARELDVPAPLLIQTLRADTPVIAGLLRPVILLPCYHYTDEEYRYVFLHELCHWKNHDMWVKLFVEVFCILFWWNPLVYLLKKDLARALELKCDGAVLKHAGAQAALDYQEVLVKTLVSSHKQKNKGFSSYRVTELVSSLPEGRYPSAGGADFAGPPTPPESGALGPGRHYGLAACLLLLGGGAARLLSLHGGNYRGPVHSRYHVEQLACPGERRGLHPLLQGGGAHTGQRQDSRHHAGPGLSPAPVKE